MDWKTDYDAKRTTAEDAMRLVRDGDHVVFGYGAEPLALGLALAARKDELRDVHVYAPAPAHDFGWYDAGWEDSFDLTVGYVFSRGIARTALDEKRLNQTVSSVVPGTAEVEHIDVLLTEVSPPDAHGFCSFGASLWNKHDQIARAKLVVAEVNDHLIRTYGENFVHISAIDHFVERPAADRAPANRDPLLKASFEGTPEQIAIAENVGRLIQDGDTVQVGVGRTTDPLIRLGMLDQRIDIGWHSEVTPAGLIERVQAGLVTGRFKTLDPGKCVATAIGGGSPAEMSYVHLNPLFELRRQSYIVNIRTIAAQDNLIAINNALAVDLTGQVSSESFGPRMWSAAGGQPTFAIGAVLARGGRGVTVLPATAQDGQVSRIVPMLAEGTIVTVPRSVVDHVVTEYGVAHLRGKTIRQRAEALIAIAHPDFRAELRREASRLYYRYLE